MTRRSLPLLVAALLASCEGLSLADQFLYGDVQGQVRTAAGLPVADAVVDVHLTPTCPTCPGPRIGSARTGQNGTYRARLAVDRSEANGATYALVVSPPAGAGLRGDTVPFTPLLDAGGTRAVTVDVTLQPQP